MATVNLGRIKPVWKGTWNNSTQYLADDMVAYNNDTWIATTTSTNSAPADANSNWDLMARGVSAGGVGTTELADGAVTEAKLAPGAAVPSQTGNGGKILTTDGSTASWGYTKEPFLMCKFNGNNGNLIESWGNFSSVQRNTTGNYRVNFSKATSNTNYVWYIDTDTNNSRGGNHVGPGSGLSGYYFVYNQNYFQFTTMEYSSMGRTDCEIVWVVIWDMNNDGLAG